MKERESNRKRKRAMGGGGKRRRRGAPTGGTATGFIFHESDESFKLMTSAHIIDSVYKEQDYATTNCEFLNAALLFHVTCVHQEREVMGAYDGQMEMNDMDRLRTPATVIGIDSPRDLLVLKVEKEGIMIREGKDGNIKCPFRHNVIPFAKNAIRSSEEVAVRGWPEYHHDSIGWIRASYGQRWRSAMSSLNNSFRYTMKLLELPGGAHPNGWSGGPVISRNCEAVGVYHGAVEKTIDGIAVSLDDVKASLIELDIPFVMDAEAPGA